MAATFPVNRSRRLRSSASMRRLVRETTLGAHNFIEPYFVMEGRGEGRNAISTMPEVYQLTIDSLRSEAEAAARLGISGALLFGIPATKDEFGTEAYREDGIVQRAVQALKADNPDFLVVTDVCLCEYTSHGHCGVVAEGDVDNDSTLDLLGHIAASHAAAGADIIAPSDMMDGRVAAIRSALDGCGMQHTPILSYAAKFASAFYGPFREAAESTPQFGDRKTYQMDPANRREALKEVLQDIDEGADMVMVKPALAYLDVLREVRDAVNVPVSAYNVSGEYAMVKAASQAGWIDEERVVIELLSSMRRAGADFIFTYHAKDAARWLSE